MFNFLVENAILTAIYNQVNNGKKICDYQCGNKVINDANRDAKLRVCKAMCDVQWDREYLKRLQAAVQQNANNEDIRNASVTKIQFAQKRLADSQKRLMKAKIALRTRVGKAPADLSMRPATVSPAFEQ